MTERKLIDHLFRHQYGKMVAVLTRIFGLHHLETIEDAIQDTFVNAALKWRQQIPDQPEAWLTTAAKNRALDLLRKLKAENTRLTKLSNGPAAITIGALFLDDQIEDSQLRMIFTACHPALDSRDQIAFALKTVAGFNNREIAAALLLKMETVKKRLSRARVAIKKNDIQFVLPGQKALEVRLARVHEVLYLIFNEGFHSTQQELLIRKELCGEAIRLTKLVLKKEKLRNGAGYALFALMCLQSARLDSRLTECLETIDLRRQDRALWYQPLIQLGRDALTNARTFPDRSVFHLEAAIALEHVQAPSFAATNWNKILDWYQQLHTWTKDPLTLLNIAIVLIQLKRYQEARELLDEIDPAKLEQRAYLYYGVEAEYYKQREQPQKAIAALDHALSKVSNLAERNYLLNKKRKLQ
ncbi:MAG: sigma-70 family RNA polymerase sigma factor [Bacteroidota bacterium]